MFSDPLVTMVGATIFLGKKHSLLIHNIIKFMFIFIFRHILKGEEKVKKGVRLN